MHVLHKAIQPAGLVNGAMTYSLIVTDAGIYGIKTGPAARELKEVHIRGAIAKMLAKVIFEKIEAKFAKKVAAGEARIDYTKLDQHAQEKGSFHFGPGAVTEKKVGTNAFGYPTLTLTSGGKTWTFNFRTAPASEIEAFASHIA
ncbi:hypothetical protein COW46_03390 [Candidatus Gracilibacteria bacterium CG17_big_fil_post_rev_8_21_14_2_50_48_13]|nr:MAG: hypothetical protein COW46_03390 [Candidatus Gracilibacteria bacterium CG17_big_fil_post_rev_8_21_14_2_50_48_13]